MAKKSTSLREKPEKSETATLRNKKGNPKEKELDEPISMTQIKKSGEYPRINVAFSPENYYFIRMMSIFSQTTMTKFVNAVITKYRKRVQEENPEFFNLSIKLTDDLKFDEEMTGTEQQTTEE